MSNAHHHAEWLSLVEVSGPFLSMPVLMRVFPQGLVAHDSDLHLDLRMAHEEWETAASGGGKRGGRGRVVATAGGFGSDPDRRLHREWVKFVLREVLELPDEVIAEGQGIQQTLQTIIPEHDETLRPDFVVVNPPGRTDAGKARMLVQVYPASQDLEHPVAGRTWKASPDTRMMELLHATNVRLGLVTNGEQWMLVDGPRNETTGYASWYATLWLEEPITLRAFRSLLGMERFFNVQDSDTLEAMLAESALNQQEVTDQLGYQVRRAVKVLIESLDQADQDHGRQLLGNIPETELYEAALNVMMRLVFLFCAEERGLMLLDDETYADNYAVSTLQAQLRETADQHGEEILERRHDAWCRLLSTFRAVHGGIEHDRLKMPAYGGRLFNPDRFAFLEGRKQGTTWKDTPADPLPVNNRTVLHLLEDLQYLQVKVPGGGQAESRRLSFRALDIEQIGHVYEGLLDHTAKRATEPVLGLAGTKDKEPEIPLAKLEERQGEDEAAFLKFLKEETGRSESALKKALAAELDAAKASQFQAACGNDAQLWNRVKPFAGLVRNDTFGYPVVVTKGSVYVTEGTDRRSSGTHYTPTSLTEPIVRYTLEPLVYVGPSEGKPQKEWKLRSARELLDLKVCDMACGSGAFLVQACRYLSQRLVEAWEQHEAQAQPGVQGHIFREQEKQNPIIVRITPYGDVSQGGLLDQLVPLDMNERMIYARRIVAQRCLYGVDKNPLAAEMAKLSLWLLTLQKDKPFTFLDHAIRSGDSLVGIANTHQLTSFSLDGNGPDMPMFTDAIQKRLDAVRLLRRQISELADNSAEDVEKKTLMLQNTDQQTQRLAYAANCLLAACWESTSATDREERLKKALVHVEHNFKDLPVEQLEAEGKLRLQKVGCPTPFHWPLEFPEVFMHRGGFDAFVGNPPFLGGIRISAILGDSYLNYIHSHFGSGNRADLCAYFFLRASKLLRPNSGFGFLATNTIAQGDSRQFALESLTEKGCTIHRAVASRKWPGVASLEVSHVWIRTGLWEGDCFLDGTTVASITPFLDSQATLLAPPKPLVANAEKLFKGVDHMGEGFLLDEREAFLLIAANARNEEVVMPFLNGKELNSSPSQKPSRYAIYFRDWPLDGSSSEPDYLGPLASDYPDCLAIVQERVKPYRQRRSENGSYVLASPMPDRWWLFNRPRLELYRRITNLQFVLARPELSNTHAISVLPTDLLFSNQLCIFVFDDFGAFAILQSGIHEAWARQFASSMRTDMRYTTVDCFETYAMPSDHSGLRKIGEQYHSHRKQAMSSLDEGVTRVYGHFHSSDDSADDIQKLRDLHVEMDNAVAAAYGWSDLDLGHGFHETKQGLRFTISEPARREVLARLLKLNHERYAEEVAKGLHNKKKGGKGGGKRRRKKEDDEPGLFDMRGEQ